MVMIVKRRIGKQKQKISLLKGKKIRKYPFQKGYFCIFAPKSKIG